MALLVFLSCSLLKVATVLFRAITFHIKRARPYRDPLLYF